MVVALFKETIDVGVDYVTTTCNEKGPARRVRTLAQRWLAEERDGGNDVVEWSGHGYVGLQAGAVHVGTRFDSVLVRVTGHMAKERAAAILQFATNCSRIDFQTTVRLINPEFAFAEYVEQQANACASLTHAKWAVRLLRDSVSGNTVYLGRRTSDRFMRIYDKGHESRLPELKGCWRGEVQFNNGLAWAKAREFLVQDQKDAYTANLVHSELSARGIVWPAPLKVPRLVAQPLISSLRQSNSARRIDWLAKQVAPTVAKEIALGHRQKVLEALGLLEE